MSNNSKRSSNNHLQSDLGFDPNAFNDGGFGSSGFGFGDESFSFDPLSQSMPDFGMPPSNLPKTHPPQQLNPLRNNVGNNNNINSNQSRQTIVPSQQLQHQQQLQPQQPQGLPSAMLPDMAALMTGGLNAHDVLSAPIQEVNSKIENAQMELNEIRQLVFAEVQKRAVLLDQLAKVYHTHV